jgi:hypothetical protein
MILFPHAGISEISAPGPGSVNARRAKRGLTGSGLVQYEKTNPAEGTLTDAIHTRFVPMFDSARAE